jgi:UDP-N-acetylmuramyl pentapeptide phosphotransferase/UDP-N-acetylglucosamine-1-phosphate transferase
MLWPLVVSFAVVLAATPIVIKLAKGRLLDIPNERSSHVVPVPRVGGIAIAFGLVAGVAVGEHFDVVTAIVVGSLALAVVGFLDDRSSVDPKLRLLAQVVVSLAMLPFLLEGMRAGHWWTWVFGAGAVLWMVAYVNAFNFMDGINGISAAQTIVAGAAFAIAGHRWDSDALLVLGLVAIGCAAGFAPFNVPKALLFLGDVGSYLLGFFLATCLVVALRADVPIDVAIAPFVYYLLDTSTTIWRRWRQGDKLSAPHREHAYQRLVQLGWSHARVSGLTAGSMAASSGLTLVGGRAHFAVRSIADVVAATCAVSIVLLPTSLDRHVSVKD